MFTYTPNIIFYLHSFNAIHFNLFLDWINQVSLVQIIIVLMICRAEIVIQINFEFAFKWFVGLFRLLLLLLPLQFNIQVVQKFVQTFLVQNVHLCGGHLQKFIDVCIKDFSILSVYIIVAVIRLLCCWILWCFWNGFSDGCSYNVVQNRFRFDWWWSGFECFIWNQWPLWFLFNLVQINLCLLLAGQGNVCGKGVFDHWFLVIILVLAQETGVQFVVHFGNGFGPRRWCWTIAKVVGWAVVNHFWVHLLLARRTLIYELTKVF